MEEEEKEAQYDFVRRMLTEHKKEKQPKADTWKTATEKAKG